MNEVDLLRINAELLKQLEQCAYALDRARCHDYEGARDISEAAHNVIERVKGSKRQRIEYNSMSDDHGRCQFTLYWFSDYHPGHPEGEYAIRERGQGFHADPRLHGFPRPEEIKGVKIKA